MLAGAKPWDQWDDERIARRVAALARVQEAMPEVFDRDNIKPLPGDLNERLAAIGVPAETARDVTEWWTSQTDYRRMRADRRPDR